MTSPPWPLRRPPLQQVMLALVARKLSGRFECGTGFIVTAELAEQITRTLPRRDRS